VRRPVTPEGAGSSSINRAIFFLSYIREMLAELTCCELFFQPAGEAPGADPPESKVQFVIGAFVAVLIW